MTHELHLQTDSQDYLYVGQQTGMPFEFVVRDVLGDKLTVINAARASFDKRHEVFLEESDSKLLRYLAEHKHTMPFRHLMMTFEIEAPEIVMRQMYRHLIGIEYTSEHSFKDTPWSEMSGRYVAYNNVYIPSSFPLQHKNKKQGASTELAPKSDEYYYRSVELIDQIRNLYNEMIENGVAREKARAILPMGTYTHVTTTWSLLAIAHFVKLRRHPDAQPEIQDVADVIHYFASEHFGEAYSVLYDCM